MSKVSQEVRDYYKKNFGYEDVDFITPRAITINLTIPGKIILTHNKETKEIVVDQRLLNFDGINDVLSWCKNHWAAL